MLSMMKQLIRKLEVLQPQPTVLSLLGILSLDWHFWPFSGIFGEVWKCVKWTLILFCKSYLVLILRRFGLILIHLQSKNNKIYYFIINKINKIYYFLTEALRLG